jgi:hypothetical protein
VWDQKNRLWEENHGSTEGFMPLERYAGGYAGDPFHGQGLARVTRDTSMGLGHD